MADDDHHVLVDDDRLTPAELGQRGGDRGDSLLVAPRVARIGHKLVDRRFDDFHGRSGAMGEGSDPAVAKPADVLGRQNRFRFADALETERPQPAASPSPRSADAQVFEFTRPRMQAKRNGLFRRRHWASVAPLPPAHDFGQGGTAISLSSLILTPYRKAERPA